MTAVHRIVIVYQASDGRTPRRRLMPGRPRGAAMRIALLCPHAWPPRDDVAHHVAAEAAALARRGHRVTVLAPATGRARVAAGRALLAAAREGDGAALRVPGRRARSVAAGRARRARGRAGAPAMAGALEEALSEHACDVVHLHEPLAPSPALPRCATPAAPPPSRSTAPSRSRGVAFLRPLLDRALRARACGSSTSAAAARTLGDILPGDYTLVRARRRRSRLSRRPSRGRAARAGARGARPRPGGRPLRARAAARR